jgi:hypothetical protein
MMVADDPSRKAIANFRERGLAIPVQKEARLPENLRTKVD